MLSNLDGVYAKCNYSFQMKFNDKRCQKCNLYALSLMQDLETLEYQLTNAKYNVNAS